MEKMALVEESRILSLRLNQQRRNIPYAASQLELFAEELARNYNLNLKGAEYAENDEFGHHLTRFTQTRRDSDVRQIVYNRAPYTSDIKTEPVNSIDSICQMMTAPALMWELIGVQLSYGRLMVFYDHQRKKITVDLYNEKFAKAYKQNLNTHMKAKRLKEHFKINDDFKKMFTIRKNFGADNLDRVIAIIRNFLIIND